MQSIIEIGQKIKNFRELLLNLAKSKEIYLGILIVVVSLLSYGLGRLSLIEESRVPIRIENINRATNISNKEEGRGIITQIEELSQQASVSALASGKSMGKYVASKNSTKYHLPWCSGAQRIKEENKIWFTTKEEAQKAGYSPAGNCKGI